MQLTRKLKPLSGTDHRLYPLSLQLCILVAKYDYLSYLVFREGLGTEAKGCGTVSIDSVPIIVRISPDTYVYRINGSLSNQGIRNRLPKACPFQYGSPSYHFIHPKKRGSLVANGKEHGHLLIKSTHHSLNNHPVRLSALPSSITL